MPSKKEKLTLVREWPVSMTVRNHLFPFRTQKLSSLVPKIVRWKRRVKIGSRRLKQKPSRIFLGGFAFAIKLMFVLAIDAEKCSRN